MKELLEVLFRPTLLNLLAYVGAFLSLYSIFYVRHKRILFQVLKRDNSYLVAFWNGCASPIFREDVSSLYFQGSIDDKEICSFSTDKDAPLEINEELQIGHKGIDGDAFISKRFIFAFDFMIQNKGYYTVIEGNVAKGREKAKLRGRLRGEPRRAVVEYSDDYSFVPLAIYWGYAGLLLMHIYDYERLVSEHSKTYVHFVIGMAIVAMLVSLRTIKFTHMPSRIHKRLRNYKKMGYKVFDCERAEYFEKQKMRLKYGNVSHDR